MEAVQSGTCILVGTEKSNIIKEVSSFLHDKNRYEKVRKISNPYGDGKSSMRIVNHILNFL